MSVFDGVIGEDKNLVIQRLLEQLALSTERDERYKSVLGEISRVLYDADKTTLQIFDAIGSLVNQALSSSPAPEPVTVDEIAEELSSAWESFPLDEDLETEMEDITKANDVFDCYVAAHLLTHFKITRKP